MTRVLLFKLLRDVRVALVAVALLLGAFQYLWAKVTERILGKLAPFFNALAGMGGLSAKDVESMVFEGPGRVLRTIIGGEQVQLDSAMDVLSIGFVHPTVQIVLCIWAVGRAAGAVAGEIDRGTMELLLAQPLARSRIILAHLLVDLITVPVLCLAMWAGAWLGAWAISPIRVEEPALPIRSALAGPAGPQKFRVEVGPFSWVIRVTPQVQQQPQGAPQNQDGTAPAAAAAATKDRLKVEPARYGPGMVLVAGLLFALSGPTMWLSARGRFRWRVLGLAVFLTLLQFLVNVLGQMWDDAAWLRPLTVFYYYQPQQVVLTGNWNVTLAEWNGGGPLANVPMPLVLFGVGAVGYLMALWTLLRRDLPAPL